MSSILDTILLVILVCGKRGSCPIHPLGGCEARHDPPPEGVQNNLEKNYSCILDSDDKYDRMRE